MLLPISLIALTLSALPTLTTATPTTTTTGTRTAHIFRRSNCTNPSVRREWRSLPRDEQISYVDAVLCLTTKPSRISLSTPLYDDFAYVHSQLSNEIHSVASFLPWHRYFLHVYEAALKECGYIGNLPLSPSTSTIWDATTGFGGDGSPDRTEQDGNNTRRCVADGPFQDLRPSYITDEYNPHCLTRTWNNGTELPGRMLGEFYSPEMLANVQASADYATYRFQLESTPHGAVHSGIGGDMVPSTSPNDPIFYLHHGQVDHAWTLWQKRDPGKRNTEYAGPRTQDQFDGVTPPEASLDDWMLMRGLAPDMQVRDAMTTQNGIFCYTY
ncbi:monooxygenase [Drepanopeziza brunnea f. sp. 'multigermtubi' MB_m1]|uniref:Monooxygenase n=1 Tax=Marssonina brunnea f. sp. multigermtubi (strain MB_m1) TaxID=1072389 RepID=K1XVY4_MARBU|nr:monooxygenase [Drepanopeziza brunnea f. sp. 'multigermtubi' MB_m1]EKD16899.1 monooxygenase [Drepanopeziza brunnea f. sp. 'multigermtubi' MB_m1]